MFDIFSKVADVHEYNTRNLSIQHVYVCSQRTIRGQTTMVLVSGIMFLIMLTQIVQLAHSENVSKDFSYFQTMIYLHDSATF